MIQSVISKFKVNAHARDPTHRECRPQKAAANHRPREKCSPSKSPISKSIISIKSPQVPKNSIFFLYPEWRLCFTSTLSPPPPSLRRNRALSLLVHLSPFQFPYWLQRRRTKSFKIEFPRFSPISPYQRQFEIFSLSNLLRTFLPRHIDF